MNALPATALAAAPLADAFRRHGVDSFRAAVAFVHGLPYGRNRDRADYRLVLEELRGTCSSKHALLAALGREQAIAIELRLGIFMMSAENTPGIGDALTARGLIEVPEAHCYLLYEGERIDVTHPGTSGELEVDVVTEHALVPADVGERKVALHRAYVAEWAEARGLDFADVWAAREAAIGALSGG